MVIAKPLFNLLNWFGLLSCSDQLLQNIFKIQSRFLRRPCQCHCWVVLSLKQNTHFCHFWKLQIFEGFKMENTGSYPGHVRSPNGPSWAAESALSITLLFTTVHFSQWNIVERDIAKQTQFTEMESQDTWEGEHDVDCHQPLKSSSCLFCTFYVHFEQRSLHST